MHHFHILFQAGAGSGSSGGRSNYKATIYNYSMFDESNNQIPDH